MVYRWFRVELKTSRDEKVSVLSTSVSGFFMIWFLVSGEFRSCIFFSFIFRCCFGVLVCMSNELVVV